VPWVPASRPLAGAGLLERLRATGRPRPFADRAWAAELRDLMESRLAELSPDGAAADGGRLVVTKDRLTRALRCPVHRNVDRFGQRDFSLPLACGALVDVLFRQIVTVGTVGDPMGEALEGLGMEGHQSPLKAWIDGLPSVDLAELRSEVDRQAHRLAERWPALEPAWLPRTQESVRASLVGGLVELSARVDLAVGRPAGDEATVAVVELKSGVRRPGHRDDLRFYALIEALRNPAPPFAVATYYSRTGELDVLAVTHDGLVEAARRCVAGTRLLAGAASDVDDVTWCPSCTAFSGRAPISGTADRAAPAVPVLPEVRAA